jgi:hypothetical protein
MEFPYPVIFPDAAIASQFRWENVGELNSLAVDWWVERGAIEVKRHKPIGIRRMLAEVGGAGGVAGALRQSVLTNRTILVGSRTYTTGPGLRTFHDPGDDLANSVRQVILLPGIKSARIMRRRGDSKLGRWLNPPPPGSDEHLRDLEMEWKSTQDPLAREAWLRALRRAGQEQSPLDLERERYHAGDQNPIDVGPETPWEQVGGDSSPLQHGGHFARVDEHGNVEGLVIDPVLSYIGAGEAWDQGYPFWIKSAYFTPRDLAEPDREVRSAFGFVGMTSEEYVTIPPLGRASVLAYSGSGYEEEPGGWGDTIPAPIRELIGEDHVRDAEEVFMYDVLQKIRGPSYPSIEEEDGQWHSTFDEDEGWHGPFETYRDALLALWEEAGASSRPEW